MASDRKSPLFLDTSIQIARHVHGPKTKEAIRRRLAQHSTHVTSLVVRQEFKRRLLKEAEYLLRLLHRYKSFGEVQQHVIRLYGPWHQRKRTICLQTLAQMHGGSDSEQTERSRLYLRSLLVAGLRRFDQMVDEVRQDSQCACGRMEIKEKEELRRYEFGTNECSRTLPGNCGIVQFLIHQRDMAIRVRDYLQSVPPERKSREIKDAEAFLDTVLGEPERAKDLNPCLTAGDLLIALESVGVAHFFTLNGIESQHYCRAIEQTLIVHPVDPTKTEVVCLGETPEWPQFGNRDDT